MRRKRRPRRTLLAGLALCTLAATCAAQELPAGNDAAKQSFEKVCGKCHPPQSVTVGRKTQAEWEETFVKMIDEQGAKGSDDDFSAAFDYLVRHYGKVNVNRAPTREMTAVLGLSAKDAEAILSYRRDKGDFQDFESLLSVPGIDVEKLKEGKDAVSF